MHELITKKRRVHIQDSIKYVPIGPATLNQYSLFVYDSYCDDKYSCYEPPSIIQVSCRMVWIGDGFPSIIVWKEENRYTFGIFQIVGMFNRRNTIAIIHSAILFPIARKKFYRLQVQVPYCSGY